MSNLPSVVEQIWNHLSENRKKLIYKILFLLKIINCLQVLSLIFTSYVDSTGSFPVQETASISCSRNSNQTSQVKHTANFFFITKIEFYIQSVEMQNFQWVLHKI